MRMSCEEAQVERRGRGEAGGHYDGDLVKRGAAEQGYGWGDSHGAASLVVWGLRAADRTMVTAFSWTMPANVEPSDRR